MESYANLIKIFGYTFLAAILITYLKSIKKKPADYFTDLVSNFLGGLLIFSGFVKSIDPLGTAYKMKDYFHAFTQFTGWSFDWLANMSTFLAVFMIVLEIVLGVAIIIGFRIKWTLRLTFAMMFFFTILTGFTYLTGYINPDFYDYTTRHELREAGEKVPMLVAYDENQMKVKDCGCFGDFLKLEPKVSFYKDIALLFVLGFLFLRIKYIQPFFDSVFECIKIVGATVFFLLFSFSNYLWGLPMVDFRPYKIGNDINALRTAIPDKLEYGFLFENVNTGEVKRVTVEEFSAFKADTLNWHFTGEQDNQILVEGIPATINNFVVFNEEGEDLTDDILYNEEYSLWVLSKDLNKTGKNSWQKLNKIAEFADKSSYNMFAFMANNFEEAEHFRHEHQIAYPFYQADETFIKTVVRANPGLVLLKNGKVLGKWHHKHLPSPAQLEKYISELHIDE